MATSFDVTPEERATMMAFFKRQWYNQPPTTSPDAVSLKGQTAIITGGNTGLGFECSKQLLDLGLSRLIIAVRSTAKGEDARKSLLQGRKRQDAEQVVEVWALDLSSYESIQAFAQRASTLDQLQIVINNAGNCKATFGINPSTGHEDGVQTNYLSAALLAILLLPILQEKNSAQDPGRFVLVNSDTAAWAQFKERDSDSLLVALDKPENFRNDERYSTTKLLGQLFLTELTRRVPSSIAVINCVNPGLCSSSLSRDFTGLNGIMYKLNLRVFGRTSEVGARALTDAAVNHGAESHGQYIEDGKLQP